MPKVIFALLLFPVLHANVAAGMPTVLFRDNFDDVPAEGTPGIPPWTAVNSSANPEFQIVVRQDTNNFFGQGTTNRFVEMLHPNDQATLQMSAFNVFSAEVVTLSFRFYEPNEPKLTHQFAIQLLAGDGSRASANRVQVLRLRSGAIWMTGVSPENAHIPYGYDDAHRIDFVVNNSAETITYRGGYTLESGLGDVWLNGNRVVAGYNFARQASVGPIRSIDFTTLNTHHVQRVFFDDITVFEGAVVGGPLRDPPPGPVTFPLRLQQGRDPSELFGYLPEHTENVPSFDSRNRPYIRSRGGDWDETSFIHTIEDGRWVQLDFIEAVREAYPDFSQTVGGGGSLTERVVFDEEDRAYMYLQIRLTTGAVRNLLLMSEDYCRTWIVRQLSDRGVMAMEHFTGHNRLEGPPFFLHSRRSVASHPSPWASYHEFRAVQPRFQDDDLFIPNSAHMNDRLISIGQHSGGSSFSATLDGLTHFAWIEVVDSDVPPEELPPGTPTFVATYDHAARVIGPPVLVAHAPPINNSHNRPGMVLDSEGYIHIVTGSHHGQNFYHTRSLQPNDAYSGWTEPVAVWPSGWTAVNGEDRGGQTYVSLVCDPDDTLHLVFRHWRSFDEYFTGTYSHYYGGLAYQRKPKGGQWSEPRLLVTPELPQYSIYYQKLAIDRIGRLFLSFSHFNWSMNEDDAARYQRRMVILSDDGGDTWRLATTEDFLRGWKFATYDEWRDYHFAPGERDPEVAGWLADAEGDRVPNLLRYAFGIEPRIFARDQLPQWFSEKPRVGFEFPWRLAATDIAYRIELSADLKNWNGDAGAVDEEEISRDHDFLRIRASMNKSGGAGRFMRLGVERIK